MPKKTRTRTKSRTRKMRRTRSRTRSQTRMRMRKYSKVGGAAPSYPIPASIKMDLWEKMMEDYKDHPKLDEADAMLEEIVYEPEYKSEFTGKTFEDREDKEYWQGLDKIQAFFKYY